ncbi:MAG TPA: aminodeoxychorismate/anthranilate synthase component II [Thermoanaerobaculia bacterium]|nr:aminodeoxychorismate/anthranilate synthase component II [Thermoanaerobaculia bacterium]
MILMIDNYDSFTWNLVQMLAAAGTQVEVVRNDAASPSALLARQPAGIVLSPGPGRPEAAGVCVELIQRRAAVPLLGVCLGHQALGVAFGAVVERAPRLMHGKTSPIRHGGAGLFSGLPDPFEATRYHSLAVREETLPAELEPLAWSDDDGTLMGLRHRQLPYWGVQFHPESVLTDAGPRLLGNFLDLCARSGAARREETAAPVARPVRAAKAARS